MSRFIDGELSVTNSKKLRELKEKENTEIAAKRDNKGL